MLRWAMQQGCAVIPGTGNPGELDDHIKDARTTNVAQLYPPALMILDHMKDNLSVYEFQLSDEDIDAINQLKHGAKGFTHVDVRRLE